MCFGGEVVAGSAAAGSAASSAAATSAAAAAASAAATTGAAAGTAAGTAAAAGTTAAAAGGAGANALVGQMVLGALSAGVSGLQAREQNKNIEKSVTSQGKAAAEQMHQNASAARLEGVKFGRAANRMAGALRVAATQAGTSEAGIFALRDNELAINTAENTAALMGNASRSNEAAHAGMEAQQAQAMAMRRSPLVEALPGVARSVDAGIRLEGLKSEEELMALRQAALEEQLRIIRGSQK